MYRTIERSVEARRDLDRLVDYFRTTSIELAQCFVDCTESTFRFLAENREVGHQCQFTQRELANIRVWPIDRFKNHLVFFRPIETGIEIVRVLHGARDIEAIFSEFEP